MQNMLLSNINQILHVIQYWCNSFTHTAGTPIQLVGYTRTPRSHTRTAGGTPGHPHTPPYTRMAGTSYLWFDYFRSRVEKRENLMRCFAAVFLVLGIVGLAAVLGFYLATKKSNLEVRQYNVTCIVHLYIVKPGYCAVHVCFYNFVSRLNSLYSVSLCASSMLL